MARIRIGPSFLVEEEEGGLPLIEGGVFTREEGLSFSAIDTFFLFLSSSSS